jgi:hypothetical protein
LSDKASVEDDRKRIKNNHSEKIPTTATTWLLVRGDMLVGTLPLVAGRRLSRHLSPSPMVEKSQVPIDFASVAMLSFDVPLRLQTDWSL